MRTFRSISFSGLTWTMSTSRVSPSSDPTRKPAISSMGACVALRPTRVRGSPTRAWRCSRLRERRVPRFDEHRSCISSMMTHSTPTNFSENLRVDRTRERDSGVVMNMWGGRLTIRCLSAVVVSPLRTATRMSGIVRPSLRDISWISSRGTTRFLWMSFASALSGETYTQ